MAAILAKIGAWLLPIFLDWVYKHATSAIESHEKKVANDAARNVVNDKNLKKLQECKDIQSCIVAVRDTYNGDDNPSIGL